MNYISINPYTGEEFFRQAYDSQNAISQKLTTIYNSSKAYANIDIKERVLVVSKLADALEAEQQEIAKIITMEMGKLYTDAIAEVKKSVDCCRYYAANAEKFLADELVETDAKKSFVQFAPIGVIFAIMPWNFPLWQVIRCVAPALAAGNVVLLKHASNVGKVAIKIRELVSSVYPEHPLLENLLVGSKESAKIIADPRIAAVTLTGSENAGRSVAETSGRNLKKTVLELGGSDGLVVLDDADLTKAAKIGVESRFLNAGQSCIAAKRFIVDAKVYNDFVELLRAEVAKLNFGDPMLEKTTLQPMARADLLDELKGQIDKSVASGAKLVHGGNKVAGSYAGLEATILSNVTPDSPAYKEEFFGPALSIIKAQNEQDALNIINATEFGLGSSVWTKDLDRGVSFARKVEAGASFVNGMTKSDSRLPFGGVKNSGYGRELSKYGLLEFINIKSIWVGE